MAKSQRPVPNAERVERIRKEILEAKKIAGIGPPRLIPHGIAFRSGTTSRPTGAISRELDMPMVRGEVNNDFLATAAEPKHIGKTLVSALDEYRKAILKRAEAALDLLSLERTPRLVESIAKQLNLAARAALDDQDLARLQAKFNEIRFGGVTFEDEKDKPGGGTRLD